MLRERERVSERADKKALLRQRDIDGEIVVGWKSAIKPQADDVIEEFFEGFKN